MDDSWVTIGGVGVGSLALTVLGGFVSRLWAVIKSRVDTIDREIEACKVRDSTQNERLIKLEARVEFIETSTAQVLDSMRQHFDSRLDYLYETLAEIKEELREMRNS